MLQVDNRTPFAAALSVFPDARGIETVYATIKATFALGAGEPEPAPQQVALLPADVFWGDVHRSSLRAAGDFALPRPATDVMLVGRAIADRPGTRVMDVCLRVGPVHKTVRVHGDRHWEGTGSTMAPSPAQPFERMRLVWERAFGGTAPEVPGQDPSKRDHEPRNPVGRGIAGAQWAWLKQQLVPNLEDPAAPIRSAADRPPPACFAPIAPTWMPRRQYAGTYDDAWSRDRAPYLPLDFDARYFQLAAPGLVAPGHLQGGEPVELNGCTLGGPLRFTLPSVHLALMFKLGGRSQPQPARLESVLFEPDLGRFQMLWRAAQGVDKQLLKLSAVVVQCDEYGPDGQPPAPLASLHQLPRSYAGSGSVAGRGTP